MASRCERAGAAMAAVDRRNPNVDDFLGLNWSCWVDRMKILPTDAASNEDLSKYGRNLSETMMLRKGDMHIYGHCPAHDDFFLVVCSQCSQVVKPQAFEEHCEWRHGSLTKMCGPSTTLAPQQRPRPSRRPSNLSFSRVRQKDGRCHEGNAQPSAALPVHQDKSTKSQEAVSLHSAENPPLPHHSSSTPCLRLPTWHSGTLPPGRPSSSTPLSERPSLQKSTAGQSSETHTPSWGQRTYSRIHRILDKKECNKHCGGLNAGRKKMCSRALICNTDSISIHQQQKSLGKSTEPSAREQGTVPAGRDVGQLPVKAKHKEQHLAEKITTQGTKFSSNCQVLRDPSQSFQEEDDDSTVNLEVQPPYPFNQSFVSSGESEDDEQEETTHLPSSPCHPKPLGLCTFGCRILGCSIFTFDRRWHHLRFALSDMMEHHVNL